MMPALVLTLRLVMATDGCYFVTNTRILALPTCDIGPATIDKLTEESVPARATVQAPQRWSGTRRRRPLPVCTTYVRGNEELERKVELAVKDRESAEVRRLVAEKERDQALDDLARVRRELAAARGRLERHCGGAEARAPTPTTRPSASGPHQERPQAGG